MCILFEVQNADTGLGEIITTNFQHVLEGIRDLNNNDITTLTTVYEGETTTGYKLLVDYSLGKIKANSLVAINRNCAWQIYNLEMALAILNDRSMPCMILNPMSSSHAYL